MKKFGKKTALVRGPTALIGDLECSKNRDRVKSALIETALIGDSLYKISIWRNFDIGPHCATQELLLPKAVLAD